MVDNCDDLRSEAVRILKETAASLGEGVYSPEITLVVTDQLIEKVLEIAWSRQFDTNDRQMFLDIRREVRSAEEIARNVD